VPHHLQTRRGVPGASSVPPTKRAGHPQWRQSSRKPGEAGIAFKLDTIYSQVSQSVNGEKRVTSRPSREVQVGESRGRVVGGGRGVSRVAQGASVSLAPNATCQLLGVACCGFHDSGLRSDARRQWQVHVRLQPPSHASSRDSPPVLSLVPHSVWSAQRKPALDMVFFLRAPFQAPPHFTPH